MTSADTGRLLLTAREAAETLSISPRKLWSITASGEIPHLKIGRSVRYAVDDLRTWIDDRKRNPRQDVAR